MNLKAEAKAQQRPKQYLIYLGRWELKDGKLGAFYYRVEKPEITEADIKTLASYSVHTLAEKAVTWGKPLLKWCPIGSLVSVEFDATNGPGHVYSATASVMRDADGIVMVPEDLAEKWSVSDKCRELSVQQLRETQAASKDDPLEKAMERVVRLYASLRSQNERVIFRARVHEMLTREG